MCIGINFYYLLKLFIGSVLLRFVDYGREATILRKEGGPKFVAFGNFKGIY